MRKFLGVLVFGFFVFVCYSARAEDGVETMDRYQKEMSTMPDLLTPDALYIGYGLDKVYYQNKQTVQLLKSISGSLQRLPEDLKGAIESDSATESVDIDLLYSQNVEIINILQDIRTFLKESSGESGAVSQ